MILANGCNITKSEKFKGVWILSVPTVYELIDYVSQHVINECLENRGGVGQPEGHNQIFKVPPGGIKHGFPLIPLPYADQMISVTQI